MIHSSAFSSPRFKARKADTSFTFPPPLSHLTAVTYKMTGTEEMVSRKIFLEYISKSYGYQKNYGYPRLLLKKNMRIAANISAGRIRVLIYYLFCVETTHDSLV